MNKIFTQLIEKRGLGEDFLHPSYDRLLSPSLLPDMAKAISRLKTAIKKQERILIYGDYDVDGVTASTLMKEALLLAGVERGHLSVMLPDRFKDGYGMSPRLVERARDTGVGLIITVDCGSSNHEIISALGALGIDTIVTDHHECRATLPPALAVINPKRPDFSGPARFCELAGVGVAFTFVRGLVESGLIPAGQEKWLLDLVLLGTICDGMLLTGENRILCYYGLKVLEKTRRPGLIELMKSAGVRSLSSEAIGFQLGPRLNAAGRLESAKLALDLLCTKSRPEAARLALRLEELNQRRRNEQQGAMSEILSRGESDSSVIVEMGDWHEGVLGIIAGQLVERFHRPAFVLAPSGDGTLKGSGRSFGDFNLATALQAVSDTTLGGGGHAAAAGVKLAAGKLEEFRSALNQYHQSLHLGDQADFFRLQPDLTISSLGDVSLELVEDLRGLEPFGAGNEEPIFHVEHPEILLKKPMGERGQHLRIDLASPDRSTLKLVAFNAPATWQTLDQDTQYDFLFCPLENEWNGTRSVEARLLDIRPSDPV